MPDSDISRSEHIFAQCGPPSTPAQRQRVRHNLGAFAFELFPHEVEGVCEPNACVCINATDRHDWLKWTLEQFGLLHSYAQDVEEIARGNRRKFVRGGK